MKKNLSILFCLTLHTVFLYPGDQTPKARPHVQFEGFDPQRTVQLPKYTEALPADLSIQNVKLERIIEVLKIIKQETTPEHQRHVNIQLEAIHQQTLKEEKDKRTQALKKLQASNEQILQANKLLASFATFLAKQHLTHTIFIKHNFADHLKLAINYLKLIHDKFENSDKLSQEILLQEVLILKNDFIEQMNSLYSNYFKSEFAGHIGNKFLCIKHKFAQKDSISALERSIPELAELTKPNIPELSQEEAVALLTDLIALWEIYQTLFTKLDTDEKDHTILLQYFNRELSVSDWIFTTSNAGFNKVGQFSDALRNSLTLCFPKEPTGPSKLSLAVQRIKAGIKTAGTALKDKAHATGIGLKEKTAATSGWFASLWNAITRKTREIAQEVTRKVEEEVDEL